MLEWLSENAWTLLLAILGGYGWLIRLHAQATRTEHDLGKLCDSVTAKREAFRLEIRTWLVEHRAQTDRTHDALVERLERLAARIDDIRDRRSPGGYN